MVTNRGTTGRDKGMLETDDMADQAEGATAARLYSAAGLRVIAKVKHPHHIKLPYRSRIMAENRITFRDQPRFYNKTYG
jgi:hypothetical protein